MMSDPVVDRIGDPRSAGPLASRIYREHGYWATLGSAIATWAVIVSLT